MERRNLDELYKDDNIGDEFEIDCVIDNGNRNDAFAFIDGDIYFANEHYKAINQYLSKLHINLEDFNERPTEQQLRELGTAIALGDVVDDYAFIEKNMMFRCNVKDVLDKLSQFFKKVYLYDYHNDTIKRVASMHEISNAYEADYTDDKVGDTLQLDEMIDFDGRDKAFVYLDGNLYLSQENQWHIHVLSDILEEKFHETYVTEDNMIDLINEHMNNPSLGFGSICGNSAFITYTENVSGKEVANSLSNYAEKIYFDDFDELRRVANILKERK